MDITPTRARRVLVIDDRAEIRGLVRATLESAGHDVVEVADATSGLRLVRAMRPDVTLLDIMMPGPIDGLQLCRLLKEDPATEALRVVIVSARGHRNDVAIGREYGADDYLLKPFSPMRLLEVIEQA